MRRSIFRISTLAAALTLVGCGGAGSQSGEASSSTGLTSGESSAGETSTGASSEGGESGTTGTGGDGGSDTGAGDSGSGGEGSTGGDGDGDEGGVLPQPGQLTAAEWRDLDNWPFWLDLFEANELGDGPWADMLDRWGFRPLERYGLIVQNSAQDPVVDALVTLRDAGGAALWSTRTDNRGRAEVFNGMFDAAGQGPFSVEIDGGASAALLEDVQLYEADPQVVTLDGTSATPNALDLMFVIDTTGSMGDELNYLQAELGSVINEVEANAGTDLGLRLSVNFYRDTGDEYLVRPFPFTTDTSAALSQLTGQSSDGGGDYPEAVVEALENAIDDHEWSGSARSRLVFFVLDAPAHESAQNLQRLQEATERAAAKGIRVIPLACSGTDKTTEFLMRFIEVGTGGTYTFLTDDSGIGGSHLEPSIGAYQVEYLDDLLVRLISEAVE